MKISIAYDKIIEWLTTYWVLMFTVVCVGVAIIGISNVIESHSRFAEECPDICRAFYPQTTYDTDSFDKGCVCYTHKLNCKWIYNATYCYKYDVEEHTIYLLE